LLVERKRLAQKIRKSSSECIHETTRRYYYHIPAEESVPGSLSFLLGLSEENLVEIFKICGFNNNNNNKKRSAFY
jgi:hypothetical protein